MIASTVVLALLSAGDGAPSGAGFELRWAAPASCPQAEDVEAAAAARVRALRPDAAVQVAGRVVQVGRRFELTLHVVGAAGARARTIADPDCAAVAEAAALIIALAVQAEPGPDAVAPPAEPEAAAASGDGVPEPAASGAEPEPAIDAADVARPADGAAGTAVEPVTVEPVATEQPRTQGPPMRRRLEVGARVGAGVGFGALPQAGAEFALAPLVQIGWIRVELPVRWQPRRPARYDALPQSGADIGRWALGPKLCGVPSIGSWGFPLCGGVEFGGMYGRGLNLPVIDEGHVAWGAALATAGVEYRALPWLRLVLLGGVGVTFIRPVFVGDTLGVVHRASRATGTLLFGVDFRWSRQRIIPVVSKR